jgi:hypothetical protein
MIILREDVHLGASALFTCCDQNAALAAPMLNVLEAINEIRYAWQEDETAKPEGPEATKRQSVSTRSQIVSVG